MLRNGVKVLWCHFLQVWLAFEGSIPTSACFHLENFFETLALVTVKSVWLQKEKRKIEDLSILTSQCSISVMFSSDVNGVLVCINFNGFLFIWTSITAPQDAHNGLVLQVYVGSNTLRAYCHLATRPEVEGFRNQAFVVEIYLKQKQGSEFCGF